MNALDVRAVGERTLVVPAALLSVDTETADVVAAVAASTVAAVVVVA